MTEFIQVSTAVDSKERANKIARRLLDERVASCVQVLVRRKGRELCSSLGSHPEQILVEGKDRTCKRVDLLHQS